jgi:hypothetical protein
VDLQEVDVEDDILKADEALRKEGVIIFNETGSRLADKLGKSIIKGMKSPTPTSQR